ncbi:hypothetical protein [Flavobacterium sp. HJ-32-4]|uniref:hypothetical protein n=1 Tax=Flavobacterium sp. HJ-32-4 TaxID=1160795 RepID=UPI001F13C830|nr:hypothetical protein [Flavobacterium sp. HJ-32-4]UMY64533.1 hypothetical protein MKO97_08415 [Flavobacterium sp. HJ-32-4]
MNKKTYPKNQNSSSIWDNDLILFFGAPLVFLLLTRFTGYSIFYGKGPKRNDRRQVFLLSGGALFYLIVILLFY